MDAANYYDCKLQMFTKYLNFPACSRVKYRKYQYRVARNFPEEATRKLDRDFSAVGGWTVPNDDLSNFKSRCYTRSPNRRRSGRVLFKFHFTNCTARAHVRVHTLLWQQRTCSAPNMCTRQQEARKGRSMRSAGCRRGPSGKPGEILEAARKPSRRPWSFFPFMRFIRSCHFACLHPRRCACAPGLASLLREEGTVRYVRHRPGGIS